MSKQKPHIFLKSIYGAVIIIVLSSFILLRGTKEKNEFNKISGKITYIDKHYKQLPNRNNGKYRYVKLDNSEQIFEIFVGKDLGDFRPSFEKIDKLNIGDKVSIYFDIDPTKTENINRLSQFIYKNEAPYYIRGSWDKYLGLTLLSLGIIILLSLSILKYKEKID